MNLDLMNPPAYAGGNGRQHELALVAFAQLPVASRAAR